MSLWSILFAPFSEYAFMRSALVACMALAVASGPLGTLLLLRRMGLVGDVLSHAVMPGAAVGFALAGSALAVLSIGGLVTGIAVVLLMTLGTRFGRQREDASLVAIQDIGAQRLTLPLIPEGDYDLQVTFTRNDGNDNIAQPSNAVPATTSIATGMIALSDSRATLGLSMVDPGSSFITPVTLAIDSAPESARITPTN